MTTHWGNAACQPIWVGGMLQHSVVNYECSNVTCVGCKFTTDELKLISEQKVLFQNSPTFEPSDENKINTKSSSTCCLTLPAFDELMFDVISYSDVPTSAFLIFAFINEFQALQIAWIVKSAWQKMHFSLQIFHTTFFISFRSLSLSIYDIKSH